MIRRRRAQARPLFEGHDWTISRRDLWMALALFLMFCGFLVLIGVIE
jgi:hypothetical protein